MESLNKLLADLNILNTKLHTFHYNVVGHDFYQTHLFLEAEYDIVFANIDSVAETIKIEGGYPLGSLAEMLSVTSIKEASSIDYTSKEIYAILKDDYNTILEECIKISEMDLKRATLDLMDDLIDVFSKKIWFLEASCK